jgi:hypothetical protein
MNMTDIYRIFHPTYTYYTYTVHIFLAVHGTFSKIDHILGHKASLRKYKKPEITPGILSGYNGIMLELNSK